MNSPQMKKAQELLQQAIETVQDSLESLPAPGVKKRINSALDLVKPLTHRAGLRFRQVAAHHVQVLIPFRSGNCQQDQGVLHTSVYWMALSESMQRLMLRRFLITPRMFLQKAEFEQFHAADQEVVGRLEINEVQFENLWAQAQSQSGQAQWQGTMAFFTASQQRVAEIHFTYHFIFPLQLASSKGKE
jgi:hypothetical protein